MTESGARSSSARASRTVRDVMVRKLVTVSEDASLGMARSCMRIAGIRHLLVLRRAKLVGLLSERDVLGAAANHGVGCLPVLSDGELVGIVTTTDLLRDQAFGDAEQTDEANEARDL